MKPQDKLILIQRLLNLTQVSLAHKLGVSFPTLNSWINGKSMPRMRTLQRIDRLYQRCTGQKTIPKNTLKAKVQFILDQKKKYKNALKMITTRPDIFDDVLLKLTYNSNAIEGSTLNEKETARILFADFTIPNKSLLEHIEAKNHQAAFRFLINHLSEKKYLDEDLILKLHAIMMNGIRDDQGMYRNHSVRIVGTRVTTSNYQKIPVLIQSLLKKISPRKKHTLLDIAKFHSEFEKIHPFSDGNGRVGRLLMIAMLLDNNLPPAIITKNKRDIYYDCLEQAQIHEQFDLLEEFISDAILLGLNILVS